MARGLGKAKKGRGKSEHTHKHKKSFPVIVENLINEVDIVLEILDARFIEKSRHYDLEKKMKNSKKVLIHVLNKADLVNTNEIVKNEEFDSFKIYLFFSVKKRRGVRTLKDLIKIEAKKLGKEVTNVGIVGYPNTGKSSIINLLTGKSSAKTSPSLFSTKCSRGVDFPGETCNSIVFTKYPNPNVSDTFWKVLQQTHKDHYWEFYKDKAWREFLQRIYRALRSRDDNVVILSPDLRVLQAVRKLQMS